MGHLFTLWMGTLLQLCHATIYTNDWAIKGDPESVKRIAEKYGFTNMGQIGDLEGYYSVLHQQTANRSAEFNKEVTNHLAKEPKVEWLQQQVVLKRVKRTSRRSRLCGHDLVRRHLHPPIHQSAFKHNMHFSWPLGNDPWYTSCTEASGCQTGMNIAAAWRRGYTGKGVVVSVLDDGIEKEHPDLKPNYDPLASCDVNEQDQDPTPKHSKNAADSHGTQCAGTVAASANNSLCTVGVSFRARIGGIRMLGGDVTDIVEAVSLNFRPQYIDIYLASWGPDDDGATLEGPGPLARLALQTAVETGRHGRGSIFVWASGNGGKAGDHCSCDGYSSSIYTISVSSVGRHGVRPEHLEQCSSTLAAAYGGEETKRMITLGPQQGCSRTLSGTSLSSSLAAGVIALTLEANPLLTWRDVQHIIVRTSKAHHLIAPDWHYNGAGYKVSHLYGFGLLDAESMAKEAERWKQVPAQHECVEEEAIQLSRIIHPGSVLTSAYETTGCSSAASRHVVYVEHIVIRVTITHSRRGDLSITLTSPAGTVSQLLAHRPLDNSTEGFQNWEFMTAHSWGEQAAGEWTLKITDTPSRKRDSSAELGILKKWSLVIYGTAEQPYHVRRRRVRSAEPSVDSDLAEGYDGPCDPECSDDGCDGPGPQQCVTCLHFFLKFKNNSRLCVSECPQGFWGDRRRCKRCYSSCASCSGSRSNQCTSCVPGHHLTEGTDTCTASCGDNYYLDHDTDLCKKCNENCLKCTSYSICTECKPGTSLQGNRCQRSCDGGFYHDAQEDECRPCDKACATCAAAGVEACSRCAKGFLMEEWRCVSSCSAGFYATEPSPEIADGHRICRRCDSSCLTCAGPSWQNCSSCSSGHRLQEGVCVVNTECTDGEYQDSDGACRACDATCLKCTGPRREDCISCGSSRALEEGRCVAECAKGKYRSGGQCHLCDHTCATCKDAGPANCTSCDTDKFGVERYLHQGQCLDACPETFYHTSKRTCQPCSENCRLCSSPNHCLQCNSSFYVSDGRCVKLECGEGEVEDPDYEECMPCEEGCRKCVLYNPRHCLSCIEGFYNFQDGCYKNCPAKTYSVEEEMTCAPCEDNCMSCDEHECYWCETDLLLSEGQCVSVCPDGFYGNEDLNECEECHPDCATCSGPENGDCLSCEEGRTLANGECVPEREVCPIKTFLNDYGVCEDCHPSCEFCSGPEKNQCTKCGKGRFLTMQQTCVSKCSAGFFASQLSGVCEACPQGCSLCADARRCSRCQSSRRAPLFLQNGQCVTECVRGYSAGQLCLSCAAGCASCEKNATHCLTCDEPLLLHDHQCVEECPPSHVVQGKECRRCPPACQDCDPLGQCTGCEEYHFLHEGQCVPECPERYFEDDEAGECLRCHADCALCDGPDSNDCDACVDPEAVLHNGGCLAPCPSDTYRNAVTGECIDCDASCLTCFGPHMGSCTSCRTGLRLDGYNRCLPLANKCSPRQYADEDGECHPCHKYCYRCSGPTETHCLSCNQGHLLFNGTCVDECQTGYYEEESKCKPCHDSCQSCVGKQSHQCLTCKAHLFREVKECVKTCQHGHYGNPDSKICEKCDPSCSECIKGGEDGCQSCAPGLVYLRKEGRCLPSCPLGYHHDAAHRTCEPCNAGCRACSGKASQSCDSCFPGYLLSDGRCESMCDIGQYPVIKESDASCEDCDDSCQECRGPGPSSCTSCSAQAILEAGGRCLLCCRLDGERKGTETPKQDCCNCTETRGQCILSTNLAFRNEEEEESRGNLTIFIIASILLVLGLIGVVFLVRHSRSKSGPSDLPPRGYKKLGSGGGFGGGNIYSGGYSSASSASGGRFQEAELVDIGKRRSGKKDDDFDDDDDDDEDIVYMGQDGTVYRKFRYGQLGDDNEDDLEYDDESYRFR
ncbi:PREDICTED: proprotein convertase subtilisin/kexin type 5-like [Poecilia mexicana]|uniref:proprotein convertase subtilisin/kexin type 5-like n=1 Tax=Poecilia mexicana TaxID=48701 RepID=UPI00072ED3A7|nr:PREDICTED: proprotein convertase subtilisin/kexin type 5-like [Poecilia mexicana]